MLLHAFNKYNKCNQRTNFKGLIKVIMWKIKKITGKKQRKMLKEKNKIGYTKNCVQIISN